ncbi:MAG TPA: DUF389 domain-containing protein [Steroidobacteraceae bacterium]|nr:DUF389 domain-containing protein [Steroidobacteraceae bacterium]
MTTESSTSLIERLAGALRQRFSLKEDRAGDDEIDRALRAGSIMRGTNLWVLMMAILIASIGLNVNSTAVIIGAMLISPLMGPILGIGYGAGILDLALIRTGLRNLGISAGLSLITSTLYFVLTPLNAAQTELLARTSPSIWDVMIAFFGGVAGIIAVTRKQPSNVIPGVAIATALMPPLCTAGYGLASGEWQYFLGAFFLFIINSVFIAVAAALVISVFHVRHKQFVDQHTEKRVRVYISVVVIVTLVPSMYLAYRLVSQELFRTRATQFVYQQLESAHTHVAQLNIDPKSGHVEVYLMGDTVPDATITDIIARLPSAGLKTAQLKIFQSSDHQVDVTSLKAGLLADLYKESRAEIHDKDATIDKLQKQVDASAARQQQYAGIAQELHALYPQITGVWMSEAPAWTVDGGVAQEPSLLVSLSVSKEFNDREQTQLQNWLQSRTGRKQVQVLIRKA